MTLTEKAKAVAARCEDAYSFKRYRSWWAVARMLLKRGLSPVQTEAFMRSKIVRWASDSSSNRYGRYSANDVARFIDSNNLDIFAEATESFVCDIKGEETYTRSCSYVDEPPAIRAAAEKFLNL